MTLGYVEIDDICHLDRPDELSFLDRDWRESYYFNMTDRRTGISLITTLGMVPNRSRTTGFILLVKDGRIALLRPVGKSGKPSFSDWVFTSGGLRYSVEGANWRISYRSKRADLDILFTPLNRIFEYSHGSEDTIECIATQHYEQAGTFRGQVRIGKDAFDIGPCYGHRDHSWGIRDWSRIGSYTLLSCTFPDGSAVNLWQGGIQGKTFQKGYYFDGRKNVGIISARIDPFFTKRGRPVSCSFELIDQNGREHQIIALVESDNIFPPPGALVHETIAVVRMGDKQGYGLLEFLFHAHCLTRMKAAFTLLSKMGVSECRS